MRVTLLRYCEYHALAEAHRAARRLGRLFVVGTPRVSAGHAQSAAGVGHCRRIDAG